jgi:ligand-binding sensor domain-containing protein
VFLWAGTDDGLNRYDGYTFKTYTYDELDPSSIGSNAIRCLITSSDGTLWIGTMGGGLHRYIAGKDAFQRYYADENSDNSIQDNSILSLSEDKLGSIWVGTQIGGAVTNHV